MDITSDGTNQTIQHQNSIQDGIRRMGHPSVMHDLNLIIRDYQKKAH